MHVLAIIVFAANANTTQRSAISDASLLTVSDSPSTGNQSPGPAATDNRSVVNEPLQSRATPAYDVELEKSPLPHVAELLNIMGGGPMSVAPDARALTITAHGVYTAAQLVEVVAVQLAAQNASVVPQGKGFILALDAVVVPNAKGLAVAAVRPGSPYAQIGVKESDVILQLDGAPITSLADLGRQMHTRKSLTLEVQRAGKVLPLARVETPSAASAQ